METLLTGFLHGITYWRRNFHPEDAPSIPVAMHYRPDFIDATARLEQVLFRLSADLKRSVPLFAPRYIGHMCSDPLLHCWGSLSRRCTRQAMIPDARNGRSGHL